MFFKPKKAFRIRSASQPAYIVELGECGEAHAQSVLEQLERDPTAPKDLTLERHHV